MKMHLTVVPKREEEAVAAEQRVGAPQPQPAENLTACIMLLDDVPLLDSPEWSSDDELDNPAYNKLFRHKKHEEIRQRLQHKRLEERERQLQFARSRRRASTPWPRTENVTSPTGTDGDQKVQPRPASDESSSRAGSQPRQLERMKPGRSKPSCQFSGSSRPRRTREPAKRRTDAATAGAEISPKEAAASPSPASAVLPEAASLPQVRPKKSPLEVQPKAAQYIGHNDKPAPAAAPVAFSATDVQPSKSHGSHTRVSKLFVSQVAKSPSKPSVLATMPESTSATSPTTITSFNSAAPLSQAEGDTVPTRTLTSAPLSPRATAKTSAPCKAAASINSSGAFNGDVVPSTQIGLDVTRTFIEPDLTAEAQRAMNEQRKGTSAVVASADETAAVVGAAFVQSPVPSPPSLYAEPRRARRGCHSASRQSPLQPSTSASAVARPVSRFSGLTGSGFSPSQDKLLQQSGNYNWSEMYSCFHFTVTEKASTQNQTSNNAVLNSTPDAARAAELQIATTTTPASTTPLLADDWGRNAFVDSNDRYSSHSGEYDGEEEGEEGVPLAKLSSGSEVDYILEYPSFYYGDLLRLTDTRISRETFSAGDATEKQSETVPDSVDTLPKAEKLTRRYDTSVVHFHQSTDVNAKSTSRDSTRLTLSSMNSFDHGNNFHCGEMHCGVTPPMYSFYARLQSNREMAKAKADDPLLMSRRSFGESAYAFGIGDSVVMTMATPNTGITAPETTATTSLPPIQSGCTGRASEPVTGSLLQRRGLSYSFDDTDPWAYHHAKKESLFLLNRLPSMPLAGYKRSSSFISGRYSLLSSKKGMFALWDAKAAKSVPTAQVRPPLPVHAPARVISLQDTSLPPPSKATAPVAPSVAYSVRPLPLANLEGQKTSESRSFDLLSPMVRQSTASPDGLLLMQEGENVGVSQPTHLVEQQQQQQESQWPKHQRQPMLSFAGLQYYAPDAFQQKQETAATAAAGSTSLPSSTSHIQHTNEGEEAKHGKPPKTFLPLSSHSMTKPEAQEQQRHVAETSRDTSGEDVHRHLSHNVYLSVPSVEVDRFRSLIGSARRTDLYTSSLRFLSSQRRLSDSGVQGDTAAIKNHVAPSTSHTTVVKTRRIAPLAGEAAKPRMRVREPPIMHWCTSLNSSSSDLIATVGEAGNAHSGHSEPLTATVTSALFTLPAFEKTLTAVPREESKVPSKTLSRHAPQHPNVTTDGVLLSVNEMVRRLEANISASPPSPPMPNMAKSKKPQPQPPLSVHPFHSSPSPIIRFGEAASTSAVSSNENIRATFQPNVPATVPPSTPRNLNNSGSLNNSNCKINLNNAPTAATDAASATTTAPIGFAPVSLAGTSKRPVPLSVRDITHRDDAAHYSDHQARQLNKMNTHRNTMANECELPNKNAVPPLPRTPRATRLTKEALMHPRVHQLDYQRNHPLPPITSRRAPHITPTGRQNQSKDRSKSGGGARGGGGRPPGGCRTTEDLLTCITVKDAKRRWRIDSDSSIVSTLGCTSAAEWQVYTQTAFGDCKRNKKRK